MDAMGNRKELTVSVSGIPFHSQGYDAGSIRQIVIMGRKERQYSIDLRLRALYYLTTRAFFLPFSSHPIRLVFEISLGIGAGAFTELSVDLPVMMIFLPRRAVWSWLTTAITRRARCSWRIALSALILSKEFPHSWPASQLIPTVSGDHADHCDCILSIDGPLGRTQDARPG